MKAAKKATTVKGVDVYLARLPKDARAVLQKLRKTIRAAAPKAVETISYQMPAYKYHGMLVFFAAFKDHCSFFPGAAAVKAYQDELKAYSTSKGTIRFSPDKPLPGALVTKLVRARVKENEARHTAKKH
jgi:uncharacterized protein YdhG (YjbR/CyaY superfamily)